MTSCTYININVSWYKRKDRENAQENFTKLLKRELGPYNIIHRPFYSFGNGVKKYDVIN